MGYDVTALDLKNTINKIDFDNGRARYSGKVREVFVLSDETQAIVVTDRVSAFDFVLGEVPFKGRVLNNLAAWWFGKIEAIGIPHHLISVPHPNISVVKRVTPLPIEIVVRGYLTGSTKTSSWYAYQNNNREISGIVMPAGMVKNQKFETPIITPTTKPEVGHDRNISKKEILEKGLVSPEVYEKVEDYAMKMFLYGQEVARERGLILVDTKYEMGLTSEGELIVIDEVHTPDSSRYWLAESYESRLKAGEEPESLDKEFVRHMIVAAGYDVDDTAQNPRDFLTDEVKIEAAKKYLELYRKMTGEDLRLDRDLGKEAIEKILETL